MPKVAFRNPGASVPRLEALQERRYEKGVNTFKQCTSTGNTLRDRHINLGLHRHCTYPETQPLEQSLENR